MSGRHRNRQQLNWDKRQMWDRVFSAGPDPVIPRAATERRMLASRPNQRQAWRTEWDGEPFPVTVTYVDRQAGTSVTG
jgi:hypothetical protein